MRRWLPAFIFLGPGVARQELGIAATLNAHADHPLGCRAGGPEDSDGGQCLIVELGDKERFVAPHPLPNLSDPDKLGCHRVC